jgi:putative CocE/NonD family hydrolase
VRHTSLITIDPLGHCLDGAEFFTEDAVEGRTALVLGQLFQTYGIHSVVRSNIKNVTFYVMSSNDEAGRAAGQYWTSLETWPDAWMTNYYFHSDKTASQLSPTPDEGPVSTTYKYDPVDPAPTMGGCNLPDSIGGTIPCGPLDQQEVDKRSDVLTFQIPAVTEELAISGGIYATLYVSSDAIDTDFTVKVSDVYPTGEARILQDNAVRMKWREGGEEPVHMEKDQVYKVEMNLWNTSYIVAPGHALRFSVSSSNFPRFNANYNNGVLLKDPTFPGTPVVAMNTLYHSAKYPSHVKLPIVRKHALPQVHVLKEVQTMYPMIDKDMIRKASDGFNRMLKRSSRKVQPM